VKPRGIGRGRLFIAAGALVIVVGCFLPWWSVGGTVTDLHTGNAFDTVLGMFVFASALAMLAVMVLPYASRSSYSPLDRRVVYVLLLIVAVVAFIVRLVQINAPDFAGLGPVQAIPGAWIAGAGLAVVLIGVIELLGEEPRER
jgi:quinol-cytochrome oxidoreductase complex cytochrome b subunit